MSRIISLNQVCKQLFSYPPPSARKLLLGQTEFEAFVFVCSRSPQKEMRRPRGLMIMCWGPSVQRDQSLRGPWLNDGMRKRPQNKARTSSNSFLSRWLRQTRLCQEHREVFVRQPSIRLPRANSFAESKFIDAHCRMQIMWFTLFLDSLCGLVRGLGDFWRFRSQLCNTAEK